MLKLTAALVFSLGAASASAVTLLTATLTNGAENPAAVPTTSAGAPRASSGVATFIINDAMTSMTFSATIFGIDVNGLQTPNDVNDNLVNAHIHAGPAVTPTTNGPVVWGFFGSPLNDNNPDDRTMTPFASGVGGTFTGKWDALEGNGTTLTAQLANILAGRSYINFHTVQFGGGEIRGNLVVSAVPEPETFALLLGGMAIVFAKSRRQRPDAAAGA